jgi:hypothetical protein
VEYWSRGKERKSNEWSVPMKQRMKIGCWKYNDGIPDGMIRAGMSKCYPSLILMEVRLGHKPARGSE